MTGDTAEWVFGGDMSGIKELIRECAVEQDYLTAYKKLTENLGEEIAYMKDDS